MSISFFFVSLAKVHRFLANTKRGFAENTRDCAMRFQREANSNPDQKAALLASAAECEQAAMESEAAAASYEAKARMWEAVAAR